MKHWHYYRTTVVYIVSEITRKGWLKLKVGLRFSRKKEVGKSPTQDICLWELKMSFYEGRIYNIYGRFSNTSADTSVNPFI